MDAHLLTEVRTYVQTNDSVGGPTPITSPSSQAGPESVVRIFRIDRSSGALSRPDSFASGDWVGMLSERGGVVLEASGSMLQLNDSFSTFDPTRSIFEIRNAEGFDRIDFGDRAYFVAAWDATFWMTVDRGASGFPIGFRHVPPGGETADDAFRLRSPVTRATLNFESNPAEIPHSGSKPARGTIVLPGRTGLPGGTVFDVRALASPGIDFVSGGTRVTVPEGEDRASFDLDLVPHDGRLSGCQTRFDAVFVSLAVRVPTLGQDVGTQRLDLRAGHIQTMRIAMQESHFISDIHGGCLAALFPWFFRPRDLLVGARLAVVPFPFVAGMQQPPPEFTNVAITSLSEQLVVLAQTSNRLSFSNPIDFFFKAVNQRGAGERDCYTILVTFARENRTAGEARFMVTPRPPGIVVIDEDAPPL